MCYAPLPGGATLAKARPKPPATNVYVPARDRSPKRRVSSLNSTSRELPTPRWVIVGLNVALGIVGIGLWTMAPGIAIFYVFIIAPAITATFVAFDRQRQPGKSGRIEDILDTVFSSLMKTVAILSLLTAAAFCAVFIFCCVMLFR
jgi:hypothetical protein